MRVLIIMAFLCASPAFAEESTPTPTPTPEPSQQSGPYADTCHTLEKAAADNHLPVDFFTRLIWQESKFDPNAESRKHAQGIAQFMPRTAASRGLTDPFNPTESLKESAGYLAELRSEFGNLGLAAAAYNAGPKHLSDWLAGTRTLRQETYDYVMIITGHSVMEWASKNPPEWKVSELPKDIQCEPLATLLASNKAEAKKHLPRPSEQAGWGPWGVILAGSWQEGKVLANFERIRKRYPDVIGDLEPLVIRAPTNMGRATRFSLRLGQATQKDAEALCARLRAKGGACLVLANHDK